MPGLFGYWTETRDTLSPELLTAMATTMQHQPDLKVETEFYPGFGAGRVYLPIFQPESQPATDDTGRYCLWLDGEFNNAGELIRRYGLEQVDSHAQPRLALALYQKAGWSFLRGADGLFNVALYDRETHQLTLANDRYGLRPLYWAKTSQGYAYAGEVKALLSAPEVQPRIDPQAVDEWFSFGYLLGNQTWLKEIELYTPATITYISAGGISTEQYWSWDDIQPLSENMDEGEVVDELGRLWIQAVERRVDRLRLGMYLSGGLDSRAVLAAIPASVHSLHAITFGVKGCDDHLIAAQVAKIHATPHSFIEIKNEGWLHSRIPAIWQTDGFLRILDLHGTEFLSTQKECFEVDIQSLAGDLILGGSYLNQHFISNWSDSFPYVFQKMWLDTPLISSTRASALLGALFERYASLLHSDYFFLDARVRRFTNGGANALRSVGDRRFPTYDKDLIDFVYSLKDELRADSRIYKKMLLKYFPEYYMDIPWEKTGIPISASKWRAKLRDTEHFFERATRFAARKAGFPGFGGPSGYTDYPTWLRTGNTRTAVTSLLLDDNALYAAYLDRDTARAVVQDFLATKNNRHLTTMGLLLTFEIYLRQLFEPEKLNGLIEAGA